MQTVSYLTTEWVCWIDDNLKFGCPPQSIVEALLENHVSAGLAKAAVEQAVKRRARLAQGTGITPDAYLYQAPRLPQSGNVIHTYDREVRVSMRVTKPVIAVFDNFMSSEECDELVHASAVKLKRSDVIDPASGALVVHDVRTSFGAFFARDENPLIARLDRRIAEVMHWPAENGEGLQIVKYSVGAEYKPHFDYFPPQDPGSQVHLAKGGQRVSTLVMYLNDVESGGATTFPEIHLAITPKKGSATYFEYTNAMGQVNPLSLHGGAPVTKGEKWIATKWMRQRRHR